jgi:hypothetical protein
VAPEWVLLGPRAASNGRGRAAKLFPQSDRATSFPLQCGTRASKPPSCVFNSLAAFALRLSSKKLYTLSAAFTLLYNWPPAIRLGAIPERAILYRFYTDFPGAGKNRVNFTKIVQRQSSRACAKKCDAQKPHLGTSVSVWRRGEAWWDLRARQPAGLATRLPPQSAGAFSISLSQTLMQILRVASTTL